MRVYWIVNLISISLYFNLVQFCYIKGMRWRLNFRYRVSRRVSFPTFFYIVWRYIDRTPYTGESDSDLRKNLESRFVWHEHYTAKQKLGFRRGFISLINVSGPRLFFTFSRGKIAFPVVKNRIVVSATLPRATIFIFR